MPRLAALAVTAALCALVLRRGTPELALVLTLAAGAVLMGESLAGLGSLVSLAQDFAARSGLSSALWSPVWKTVGIGLVTRLGASLCRDSGQGGLAAFLETAGAVAALTAALPLVELFFDTLAGL